MAFMRIIFIFICLTLVPSNHACCKCRELNVTQVVNYAEIEGKWFMAASHTDLNMKCRNIVISKTNDNKYELKDEYYKKSIFLWWHKEKVYCMKDNRNSSKIEVQKKSFPYYSSSYNLIHGDFNNYMILHWCYNYFFFKKESFEIWARDGTDFNCLNATDSIVTTLGQYKIKLEDMICRVPEDCDK